MPSSRQLTLAGLCVAMCCCVLSSRIFIASLLDDTHVVKAIHAVSKESASVKACSPTMFAERSEYAYTVCSGRRPDGHMHRLPQTCTNKCAVLFWPVSELLNRLMRCLRYLLHPLALYASLSVVVDVTGHAVSQQMYSTCKAYFLNMSSTEDKKVIVRFATSCFETLNQRSLALQASNKENRIDK